MFHHTLCRADGKMSLYPLGLLQGDNKCSSHYRSQMVLVSSFHLGIWVKRL